MSLEFEIYTGKNYTDLIKEIYVRSEQKNDQIKVLIGDIRNMVKSANDAIILVPLIKNYLEVGVRNDEQLVKLAAVLQRFQTKSTEGSADGFGISEEEKEQLLKDIESELTTAKREVFSPISGSVTIK